jgi:GTP cyclohydrolase I
MTNLPDIQNSKDIRNIAINRVGVEDVPFLIQIKTKKGGFFKLYSKVSLFSSLPHDIRGTNMSRYLEVLYDWKDSLSGDNIHELLNKLKDKVKSDDVYVKVFFKYPIEVKSPVSKKEGYNFFDCDFIGLLKNGEYKFYVSVEGDVTTYCPCSKEMSLVDKEKECGWGAHAQRGRVRIITLTEPVQPGMWIEDIATIIGKSGSSNVYPLLKRPDEKYVTEYGYKNAKFVEDVARDASLLLQKVSNLKWFSVKVVNYESIHQHNAVCYIIREKVNNEWCMSSSI